MGVTGQKKKTNPFKAAEKFVGDATSSAFSPVDKPMNPEKVVKNLPDGSSPSLTPS
jgi:hypothetical protein